MAFTTFKSEKLRKILVKELNDGLICTLCNGYLIDATRLIECFHVFCRGCILRHFENSKAACPTCNIVVKKKSQPCFRSDPPLQALVYKLVPGLFTKEMQRREDFYRSTGVRASSSCSDDSVLERERDLINDQEAMIAECIGDKTQFFGPEDYISLSLEYYQIHLDKTPINLSDKRIKRNQLDLNPVVVMDKPCDNRLISVNLNNSDNKVNNNNNNVSKDVKDEQTSGGVAAAGTTAETEVAAAAAISNKQEQQQSNNKDSDKRYLQCPAAVTMRHLQKFVRMKYALTSNHRVDIIYEGEVLPQHFSLMDVAYTFKWKRLKPLRFFYRIFTPLKIQPIKIINTSSSTGEKHLQIVKTHESPPKLLLPTSPRIIISNNNNNNNNNNETDAKLDEKKKEEEKEILLAHLQLQSKSKVQNNNNNNNNNSQSSVPEKQSITPSSSSTTSSSTECVFDYGEPDKEEIKRFAETRDREWALQKKLDESRAREEEYHHSKKRKKSKHSKNDFAYKKRKLHAEITNKAEELKLKVKLTTPNNGHKHKHHKSSSSSSSDLNAKLLQIRHKHEDKKVQTLPTVSKETSTDPLIVDPVKNDEKPQMNGCSTLKPIEEVPKIRTDYVAKTTWTNRVPTVQIERNEQTEQAQKTFQIKTFQNYNEKFQKKVEKCPPIVVNKDKMAPPQSQLERKIANLQQRCTIETKPSIPTKPIEKKLESKPTCPPGFTVSKIDNNKRKLETPEEQDRRPSLEITLINPPVEQTKTITPAKRPPPATIPLERIKKCKNLKTGLSIIPKMDGIGALDLSKTSNGSIMGDTSKLPTQINGYQKEAQKPVTNNNMSNLQMLSKVATEHLPTSQQQNNNTKQLLNNNAAASTTVTQVTPKPRPQMPPLQTLKIPSVQTTTPTKIPNLHLLPKLTEINKHYRMNQIRNLRPNQNQNIRNIPNPSLLVRQQNQNRLNSINSLNVIKDESKDSATTTTSTIPPTTIVPTSTNEKMIDTTTPLPPTMKIPKLLDTTTKEAVSV